MSGFLDKKDFDIEFMEKTQNLINGYKGPLSFSLLTNCLYSLVILSSDRVKGKAIPYFMQLITDVPELDSIRVKPGFVFQPVTGKRGPQEQNLMHFIVRMRNSLAHLKIAPENEVNPKKNLILEVS
jgi:hypothetical protein